MFTSARHLLEQFHCFVVILQWSAVCADHICFIKLCYRVPQDADSINSAVEDHLSITEKKSSIAIPGRFGNKANGSVMTR